MDRTSEEISGGSSDDGQLSRSTSPNAVETGDSLALVKTKDDRHILPVAVGVRTFLDV